MLVQTETYVYRKYMHMNDMMNGIIIKTVSKFPVYVVFTNTYQIKTGRHYPDVLK